MSFLLFPFFDLFSFFGSFGPLPCQNTFVPASLLGGFCALWPFDLEEESTRQQQGQFFFSKKEEEGCRHRFRHFIHSLRRKIPTHTHHTHEQEEEEGREKKRRERRARDVFESRSDNFFLFDIYSRYHHAGRERRACVHLSTTDSVSSFLIWSLFSPTTRVFFSFPRAREREKKNARAIGKREREEREREDASNAREERGE